MATNNTSHFASFAAYVSVLALCLADCQVAEQLWQTYLDPSTR